MLSILLLLSLGIAGERVSCPPSQFQCSSDSCIYKYRWCDGRKDCPDGSDEANCIHTSYSFSECSNLARYNRWYQTKSFTCKDYREKRLRCIPIEWTCDGFEDCRNGADEKLDRCIAKRPCTEDEFRCQDGLCISKSQVCNGVADCRDKSDENCWRKIKQIYGIESSLRKLQTFMSKAYQDRKLWKKEFPRAFIAFYFSNKKLFQYALSKDLQMMLKELENNIATEILRNDPETITPTNLALYINSLLPTCGNPRNFVGVNLVEELIDLEKEATEVIFSPLVPLALCHAGLRFSGEHMKKMETLLNTPSNNPFIVEMKAQACLALSCAKKLNQTLPSSINITGALQSFKTLQEDDGSFGTLRTTAVMVQALIAQRDNGIGWNFSKAIEYILSRQHANGSFEGELVSTYLVAPILDGSTLVDLFDKDCIGNWTVEEERLREIRDRLKDKIQIKYSLRLGDNMDVTHTIGLAVPANISFFDVMILASKEDAKFQMEYKRYTSSVYVYSLLGVQNNFEDMKCWQLYKVIKNAPTKMTKDVTQIFVKDKDEFIMWYRQMSI